MKQNNELLQIMQDYVQFMDSDKTIDLPVVVSEHKKNHPSSLYYVSALTSVFPFGETKFDCGIRDRDVLSYSFQIRSDKFESQVALRFDEGDAAHRTDIPGLPLDRQSVTTPHFHRYNEQGYLIAYKNEELNAVAQTSIGIEDGFDIFLREAKIGRTVAAPLIKISENGIIQMNLQQTDPLAGVNF